MLVVRNTLIRTRLRSTRVQNTYRFSSNSSGSGTDAAQKKAQDALANAQANAGKAFESAQKLLEPLGARLGNLLGGYKQPILYNLSVTKELAKQIYVAEALQPPNVATVRSAYQNMWQQATSGAFWRSSLTNGDLVKLGIYGVQAYGIFKIGEMVGRRHVVGYALDD